MIEYSGGRAGPNEYGWIQAGYQPEQIEDLRQQHLSQKDAGKIQRALQKLGLIVKRTTIESVKRYIFDSQGLAFTYENYAAWRRLATGQGKIADAAFLIHEITEVEELQRIQQETGFEFMKFDFKSAKELKRWKHDFNLYYKQSHSQALEAEYEFIAEQVLKVTNRAIKVSKLQAAAIDPTRNEEAWQHLWVDGVPMEEHHHFDVWLRRANEVVSLGKSTQRRLGYYRKKITIERLIRYLKNMRIN